MNYLSERFIIVRKEGNLVLMSLLFWIYSKSGLRDHVAHKEYLVTESFSG